MLDSESESVDSIEYVREIVKKSEKKKSKRKLLDRVDPAQSINGTSNNTLDTFFEARKHLKPVKGEAHTQNYTIGADEEVWIIHCAKNIRTDDLLGRKLILPQPVQTIQSKKGGKEFECKLELTKQENHLTVLCPSSGWPEAISFKQAGMISIRERIRLPEWNELGNRDTNSTDDLFSFPDDLKERHPLLGVDFANVGVKQERRGTNRKKKSRENGGSDRIKYEQEKNDKEKKHKKRKRPRDSDEESAEDVPLAKKSKHNRATRPAEDNDETELTSIKHKNVRIKVEH